MQFIKIITLSTALSSMAGLLGAGDLSRSQMQDVTSGFGRYLGVDTEPLLTYVITGETGRQTETAICGFVRWRTEFGGYNTPVPFSSVYSEDAQGLRLITIGSDFIEHIQTIGACSLLGLDLANEATVQFFADDRGD